MEKDFDAELHNWTMHERGGKVWYSGNIYHDKKKRFNDGDFVTTSPASHLYTNDGLLQTRNTLYKLVPAKK